MVLKNNKISFLNSGLINLLINQLIKNGNKTNSIKMINKMVSFLKKQKPGIDPIYLIYKAIDNVKPYVEIKTFKQRNFSIQQPTQISKRRQEILAIRWIIQSAKSRKEKGFWLKLVNEFIDAYENKGASIAKKVQVHKLAIAQKRFLYM